MCQKWRRVSTDGPASVLHWGYISWHLQHHIYPDTRVMALADHRTLQLLSQRECIGLAADQVGYDQALEFRELHVMSSGSLSGRRRCRFARLRATLNQGPLQWVVRARRL